jgi:alpha-tubulin suppressor-like RCC1 family protein
MSGRNTRLFAHSLGLLLAFVGCHLDDVPVDPNRHLDSGDGAAASSAVDGQGSPSPDAGAQSDTAGEAGTATAPVDAHDGSVAGDTLVADGAGDTATLPPDVIAIDSAAVLTDSAGAEPDVNAEPDLAPPGPDAPVLVDAAAEAQPADAPGPEVLSSDGCVDGFRSGDRCISRVVSVAAAQNRTCALLHDGTVWCWGGSPFLTRPAQITDLHDARVIALGGRWAVGDFALACVITAGERVLCWGSGSYGALGDGNYQLPLVRDIPQPVVTEDGKPLEGAKSLALGIGFGCASTATGVYCWGDNSRGQLASPLGAVGGARQVPGLLPPVYYRPYAALAAGAPAGLLAAGYDLVISADRTTTICGWGASGGGQTYWPVANGLNVTPICRDLAGVRQIVAGFEGVCALRDNGEVGCWGYQLGAGATAPPGGRADIALASQIAAGVEHYCALQTDGRVFCWGNGHEGELGNGPAGNQYQVLAPQEVKGLGADSIGIGSGNTAHHTCAIVRDGSLRCWGRNDNAQLANSTVGAVSDGPVPVRW